ncbi:5,10-methylenetetrahydrofolate reductase (NAD(P)) [Ectothiorhodosinus mongolicus]|uniref:Methylenetetrahydrofolate reductase n=1 Tax=Ectothiorhodosinus mongolicus TaxID=233100 RepID=A0A1R3W292_9GAMM|nr:methylenetetrahydrofolate reductase [NAD(P)H] [Ectothiorhodosinus mongolicus]ULX57118.1 methylenetetrahydrofolate reductase [NAD(P)H] [Ectothiorhodosinus mongolicus]SIT70012.1 5,10-methylenetetrahydrofolate reductase (NAD(P)) [Ectothiorhodosinus mongolicus]
METQKRFERTFSFEFFPPKNPESAARLRDTWTQLAALGPRFFSVTYGAGGSTQARTLETVLEIHRQSGVDAAPHLSCIDSSREQMREILQTYQDAGLKHIVALRGDLPSGMHDPGEFRYANELVGFIREETGDHFTIEVAAYPEFHPQALSPQKDLWHFKQKVEAGADSAITQYFYSADAYFRFIDDVTALGVNIPIVPGIMPITNFSQLARFSDACGAEIPRWIRQRLQHFGDDKASIRSFGEAVVTQMCERLLDAGAPGLHFYTMNQVSPSMAIWTNLGLAGAETE